MKKQDFFFKILSLVAFRLRGPGTLGHLPGYAYNFEIRSRPKIKITFFPNRGELESSHLTVFLKPLRIAVHYYDVDTWSSLLLLTFVRVNSKLKKLQFRTKTTYWLCSHYIYHW